MKAFRVANGILVIQRNQSVSVLGRSFTPSTVRALGRGSGSRNNSSCVQQSRRADCDCWPGLYSGASYHAQSQECGSLYQASNLLLLSLSTLDFTNNDGLTSKRSEQVLLTPFSHEDTLSDRQCDFVRTGCVIVMCTNQSAENAIHRLIFSNCMRKRNYYRRHTLERVH